MLHSRQIRAARGLLGWRQHDLARRADVALTTVRRLESVSGPAMGNVSTLLRIQDAFEKAGLVFLDKDAQGGIGVRFAK